MTAPACPTDAELAAFHRGNLPNLALERVADHLEHCSTCDAKLREFEQQTDPVLDALRQPAATAHSSAVPTALDPSQYAATYAFRQSGSGSAMSPSQEVPGYALLDLLGQGGMGVVHKALHLKLKRLVALKRLRTATDWDRDRFRREAEAVARLEHPNIVQIYEIGEHQGQSYLALEFVSGGTLSQLIGGKPQPARPSAELVRTLARAMHYAHERGVVHRDLKPANILIKSASKIAGGDTRKDAFSTISLMNFVVQSTPKIADFGVAKCLDDGSGQTADGDILGTPSYMAPEQARGRSKQIGPATDVYALGAILYEMIAGRPPYDGDCSLETLRQVLDEDPVPPTRLQSRLPRDVETIALKCLQKDPAKRYPSAADLADDLDRFLDGRTIAARPTPAWERMLKAARRRPREARLAMTAVLSVILGLVLVTWQWRQAVSAREAAQENEYRERQARRLTERRESRLAFERGTRLCEDGEIGRGLHWLARGLKLADLAGADDLAHPLRVNLADWGRQLARPGRELVYGAGVRAAVIDREGRRLVAVGDDGQARFWDVASGQPVLKPLLQPPTADKAGSAPPGAVSVALSSNGRLVLVGSGDATARLWELPADGGAARLVRSFQHPGGSGGVWDVAVSPNSSSFATASEDGAARLWRADSDQPTLTLLHGPQPLYAVAFLDGGRVLLTAGRSNGVRLWDTASGQDLGPLAPAFQEVFRAAVSPNGRTVLTGGDQAAQLWDYRSRRPLGRALPHTARVEAVAFSPDGELCATGDNAGCVRLWHVATRQPFGPVIRHDDSVRTLQFTRDGRQLLVGGLDGRLHFWHLPAPRMTDPPLVLEGAVLAAAYSSDGTRLLTASDQAARLWPASGRSVEPPLPLAAGRGRLTSAALSPDKRLLAIGAENGTDTQVWDLTSTPRRGPKLPHKGPVSQMEFSPDGKGLLTISAGLPGGVAGVQGWDLTAQPPVSRPWTEPVKAAGCAAFLPGGRLVLIGCTDRTARFWDWPARRPDGGPLPHPDRVTAVTFTKDGRIAATGCRDGSLHLWDVVSRQRYSLQFGCPEQIDALAFSPDGRTLLAGSKDRAARFWDVRSGLPLGGPLRHEDAVQAVSYHPNGQVVATGGRDGVVLRWRVPPAALDSPAEQIRCWVEALTQLELDDDGAFHSLDGDALRQRSERLAQLGGAPGPDAALR